MTPTAPSRARDVATARRDEVSGLDVGLAVVASTVGGPVRLTISAARGVVGGARTVAVPVAEVVLHPPLVPARLHPGGVLAAWSRRGRREREVLRRRLDDLLDTVVPRVSDEVVGRIDLQALLTRLDLTQLAQTVIVEVDLPEIIRESTSAVSSGAVREVRMRGISGDESVGRVVDRLLLRHRRADAPT